MGDVEKDIEAAVVEQQGASTEAPAQQAQGTQEAAVNQEVKSEMNVADDPEITLTDENGNPEKVKLSQIRQWKKEHMLEKDYRVKTAEASRIRKQAEESINFVESLKALPEAKRAKLLAVLEDREEQAQEALQQQANPQSAEGQALMKYIKQLESKISSLEQHTQQTVQEKQLESARKVLNNGLEEVQRGLQFDDEEDKSVWRQMVLSHLKDNPQTFETEDEFKSVMGEVGKRFFDILNKVGEKKVKKYLESKKGPITPAPTGVTGDVMKNKPTYENLEELSIPMIQELMDTKEE